MIKSFKIKEKDSSGNNIKKILFYIISSIIIFKLTLSSFIAFWIVIVLMGISGIVSRFEPKNITVKKYAFIGVLLGLINLFLLFNTIQFYENLTEKLAMGIEDFHKQNSYLPTDIKLITKDLDFNFIELYFSNKIDYRSFENYFELETELIMGKRNIYYKKVRE